MKPAYSNTAIERVVREERDNMLAILCARYRDIQLAEDSLQDASIAALTDWTSKGIPNHPGAWLVRVAGRKMIDTIRRREKLHDITSTLAEENHETGNEAMHTWLYHDDNDIPDKRLGLLFACCHPAIMLESRIPLTLQVIGGLSAGKIARAFLVSKSSMAQRLVRAKRKIKQTGIPFKIPQRSQIGDRLNGVLHVLYLIFNEGHSAIPHPDQLGCELMDEAIRLTGILAELTPDEPETLGLLAMMKHHHARTPARRATDGSIIQLQDHDHSLWNQELIESANQDLERVRALSRPGPYQIQAAVSALHNDSSNHTETDWRQIHLLYNRLYQLQPSPIVELNAAVALSYAASPTLALNAVLRLADDSRINDYQPRHAALGDLHHRCSNTQEAIAAFNRAMKLSGHPAEQHFFLEKIQTLQNPHT